MRRDAAFLRSPQPLGLVPVLVPRYFRGALLALASGTAEAQRGGAADESAAAGLPKITDAMIEAAAAIAGVSFTPEQRTMMLEGLNSQRDGIVEVRKMHVANSVAPSLVQDPVLPGMVLGHGAKACEDGAGAFSDTDFRKQRRAGCVCDGSAVGRVIADQENHVLGAYEAVSCAPEALRSDAAFCDHAYGTTSAGSGRCC